MPFLSTRDQPKFIAELKPHELPINASLRAQGVVRHCVQLLLPALVEFPQPPQLQGRIRHGINSEQGFSIDFETLH